MAGNLLDTHTFLWYLSGDRKLSDVARKTIEKSSGANYISIATLWEIAIKVSLGKLDLHGDFTELHVLMVDNGFQLLPITFDDTLLVSRLPFHHRDPFDRIIIAQVINRKLQLISRDNNFSLYDKAQVTW